MAVPLLCRPLSRAIFLAPFLAPFDPCSRSGSTKSINEGIDKLLGSLRSNSPRLKLSRLVPAEESPDRKSGAAACGSTDDNVVLDDFSLTIVE